MTRLALVVVVAGVLGVAFTTLPPSACGGDWRSTLSCDGGFCNTAPTQACTSNDTATLEAECPCQCTNETGGTDFCYHPGGACTVVVCNTTDELGYNTDESGQGVCALETLPLPCCETHDDCTAGNVCSMARCTHASGT